MGNCLPLMFGRGAGDETPLRSSRSSSRDSTMQGFANPVAHHPNSSYVNQLYAANMQRRRSEAEGAAPSEGKRTSELQRKRVQGLLEQIPSDFFRADMKQSECAICMIDFEPGEVIRFLPCMHSFHQECVDDWLLRSFVCPSCTEPVDSTLLSSLTAHQQQQLSDLACSPANKNVCLGASASTPQ